VITPVKELVTKVYDLGDGERVEVSFVRSQDNDDGNLETVRLVDKKNSVHYWMDAMQWCRVVDAVREGFHATTLPLGEDVDIDG
jgi:hypothetical protein